jgi:hypothetical protein
MATVQKRMFVKVTRDGKVGYEDHRADSTTQALLRELARRRGVQLEVDFTYTKRMRG